MKVALVQRFAASLAAATLLGGALAPLAAAQEPTSPTREPQTFTVAAGGFDEPSFITVNAFLPDTLTVNAGDTVTWNIVGFHTVTFPGGGQAPPPLIVPDPANAQQLMVNPTAAAPTQTSSFDGSSLANSGLPPDNATGPVTFALTFPKAGTYSYVCVVHPAMVGTVTVQTGGERPMTPEQVSAVAEKEQPEYIQAVIAKEASISTAGAQPVWAGVVAAGGKAESLHFVPKNVTIQAGQSVTWKMDAASQEPHTVTFLSGGAPVEFIIPGPAAGGPPTMLLNPQAINPAGGPSYSGNGYTSSGLMAGYSLAPGQPPHDTYTLAFATPGTYDYYCIVHGPDMSGTVTVLGANGVAPQAQTPAVQVPSTGK